MGPLIYGRPFIIDLESANGTTVNEEKIPESRFFELRTGDSESFFGNLEPKPDCAVIKFAYSTRDCRPCHSKRATLILFQMCFWSIRHDKTSFT